MLPDYYVIFLIRSFYISRLIANFVFFAAGRLLYQKHLRLDRRICKTMNSFYKAVILLIIGVVTDYEKEHHHGCIRLQSLYLWVL